MGGGGLGGVSVRVSVNPNSIMAKGSHPLEDCVLTLHNVASAERGAQPSRGHLHGI